MRFQNQIRYVISVAFCLALTNASAQDIATATPGPLSKPAANANTAANITSPPAVSQFILGAADIIRINVWKNTELSQTVTIGPDGFVSLPLLGDVHVSGMTANELGAVIASRLSSFIVSPQVTVSVVDIHSRQVYVLGQVNKPGGYPLIAPITVLQLIAQAGGLNTYANRKGIVILRATKDNVQKIPFNYNNVIHGNAKQNIDLQPGDTVVVP
ncbi:polysaccharide biosynthesis/export family protein [Acidicapsa ligni]|uniref:polysaccharide biosynthesis/export family protein n=1 Tax=Acidicapsa ligni TaxID=542300 RepID=UPI0021DFAE34|nr:polysaccharide biosynthesis/export family protein [Acidicapsa ligni]